MKSLTWPAWFNSPDGKNAAIFATASEVPSGWTSGAEKQTVAGNTKPVEQNTQPSVPADTKEETELDAEGWPWSDDLHASSKSRTKDGLWRMKPGVTRPDPKPGYPLDL